MAAFKKGAGGPDGMGQDVDLDDILASMFGGMGGMPEMGAGPGRRRRGPTKAPNEEQEYEVTLEELYKGKTTKFNSLKDVICSLCHGSGGKEKAKPKLCEACKGAGSIQKLMQVGPGLVAPTQSVCGVCNGKGEFFKEKERCKRCKGNRTVKEKKLLELYIAPGSRQGDKIILSGEADQIPDAEPGDLVFELVEKRHATFERAGADLSADLEITLAEALIGFDRVILTHLDGRGLQLRAPSQRGEILRPDQTIKVTGEGMPVKRSADKGDLYLHVNVDFPEDGWFSDPQLCNKLREVLPGPPPPIKVNEVDEVEYDPDADMDGFGAGSGDPRAAGAEWEDDEEVEHGPQCAQQ